MSGVSRALGFILFVVALAGAVHFALIESGEVVTIWTEDDFGLENATRVWIVEYDGSLWLNAGDAGASWLAHITARPQVRISHGGTEQWYHGTPMPGARDQILHAMAEKYGIADTWVRMIVGDESIPVRLDPAG